MQGPPRARGASACATVLAAAVLVAWGGRARAAEPELGLTWQAPQGCPSPADVEAQFVRLLGARFGLSLDLDGALRLYHPAFCAVCQPQVDNGTQVLRVPAANAFGALGIFVTL